MSIEDLESAVSRLSAEELARFSAWFEQFMADQWDRQIEEDIKAGRLDAAGKQADEDFEYAPLLAPCRRPILIATKYMLFRGQDTRTFHEWCMMFKGAWSRPNHWGTQACLQDREKHHHIPAMSLPLLKLTARAGLGSRGADGSTGLLKRPDNIIDCLF
ncbi:MAG TPA: hypothetical protein VGY91_12090 [Chthoniobacterales bacterium]|jgi:hypothetical protein|nr:hypothetical protein [Chthoniobacterales bacterium]